MDAKSLNNRSRLQTHKKEKSKKRNLSSLSATVTAHKHQPLRDKNKSDQKLVGRKCSMNKTASSSLPGAKSKNMKREVDEFDSFVLLDVNPEVPIKNPKVVKATKVPMPKKESSNGFDFSLKICFSEYNENLH